MALDKVANDHRDRPESLDGAESSPPDSGHAVVSVDRQGHNRSSAREYLAALQSQRTETRDRDQSGQEAQREKPDQTDASESRDAAHGGRRRDDQSGSAAAGDVDQAPAAKRSPADTAESSARGVVPERPDPRADAQDRRTASGSDSTGAERPARPEDRPAQATARPDRQDQSEAAEADAHHGSSPTSRRVTDRRVPPTEQPTATSTRGEQVADKDRYDVAVTATTVAEPGSPPDRQRDSDANRQEDQRDQTAERAAMKRAGIQQDKQAADRGDSAADSRPRDVRQASPDPAPQGADRSQKATQPGSGTDGSRTADSTTGRRVREADVKDAGRRVLLTVTKDASSPSFIVTIDQPKPPDSKPDDGGGRVERVRRRLVRDFGKVDDAATRVEQAIEKTMGPRPTGVRSEVRADSTATAHDVPPVGPHSGSATTALLAVGVTALTVFERIRESIQKRRSEKE